TVTRGQGGKSKNCLIVMPARRRLAGSFAKTHYTVPCRRGRRSAGAPRPVEGKQSGFRRFTQIGLVDCLGASSLTTAHSPLFTIFKEFALTQNRALSKLILPLLLLAGLLAAACGPAPEAAEPAAEATSTATAGSEEAAAEPTRAPAGELITTASG